ncbi:MAG: dephospho-CoA kinase [Flavobacteriaceae bacterium]|nr:dephospho-CoA kinase [Flavobacteriaceae bacterium]MDO7598370.1 dephospho-CoA kinase [Flavobacteriaceae bacterium]
MPKIVGLTGGIGSGKSTAAAYFSELGIPCYISDDRAKELMTSSITIQQAIINEFGAESYINGNLNRPFLASIVFKDTVLLATLNAIVHPAVASDFRSWLLEQNSIYVIKEAAILFENGGAKLCDQVILVTAPKEIRVQRVIDRDKCTKEDVLERMSKQWSDAKKKPLADYIIENIEWKETSRQIEVLHQKLNQIS